jgi:hypothetical protein
LARPRCGLSKEFYLMKKICILLVLFTVSVFSILAQSKHDITDYLGLTDSIEPKIKSVESKNLSSSTSQPVDKKSLGDFTTGDAVIDRYIEESCARHDIDPLLIYAQMKQESRFKRKAVSHKGAGGLMQLMPDTASRFGVKNLYDPKQNIEAGVKYMRWLLDKFDGDVRLALAGYNAGEGAVMRYDNRIPPYRETRQYVVRIIAHYERISDQG